MKLGIISKRNEYTHSTPVMEEMVSLLHQAGIQVERIVPEEESIDLARIGVACDGYAIRPGIEHGLSLAGILHDQGARLINSYPATALLIDKLQVTQRLLAAGLPSPRSYITGDPAELQRALGGIPLIIKPHRGSYGQGIRVLHPGGEIEAQVRGGYFVQEFLPSDGVVLKVYVIGNEVQATRRTYPARNYEEKFGVPCPVSGRVRDIAQRIGELFGLEIYGIDCIETDSGPQIIDVNYFPGFIGVANAPALLADFLIRFLREELPRPAAGPATEAPPRVFPRGRNHPGWTRRAGDVNPSPLRGCEKILPLPK